MNVVTRDLVPLPGPRASVPPVEWVRSTLLTSALAALKEGNLLEDYRERLPLEWHDRIFAAAPGAWLPIEYANVHYRTGDSLGLAAHQIIALGTAVGRHTANTILAFVLRVATEAGATPAAVLATTPRLWGRCFKGGCVTARMIGPKDAIFESIGIPMARYRYFRTGYRALLTDLMAPFCTKVYMKEIPELTTDAAVGYAIAWV